MKIRSLALLASLGAILPSGFAQTKFCKWDDCQAFSRNVGIAPVDRWTMWWSDTEADPAVREWRYGAGEEREVE